MGLSAALIDTMRKPSGGSTFDEAALSPTPVVSALRDRSLFRPQGQALALEQRLMFDGAAASAAHQQHGDSTRPPEPATAERTTATPATARSDAGTPAATPPAAQAPTLPPQHLLVVDSRVDQRELLSAQNTPGVSVLVVNTNEDGLAPSTSRSRWTPPPWPPSTACWPMPARR